MVMTSVFFTLKPRKYDLFDRHSNRPSIRMLHLLEGTYDQRNVGAELHLAHRRQAVPGVLRKLRWFDNSVYLNNQEYINTQ